MESSFAAAAGYVIAQNSAPQVSIKNVNSGKLVMKILLVALLCLVFMLPLIDCSDKPEPEKKENITFDGSLKNVTGNDAKSFP